MQTANDAINEKIHGYARGLLRLEDASYEKFGKEPNPTEAIRQTLWANLCSLLGAGGRDLKKFPDSQAQLPDSPQEFVNVYRQKRTSDAAIVSNYNRFAFGSKTRKRELDHTRHIVRSNLVGLQHKDMTDAERTAEILTEVQNGYDTPIYVDLMLNASEIAQHSDVFRNVFHSSVAPMKIGPDDGHTIDMNVASPVVDYMFRDHERRIDPVDMQTIVLSVESWKGKTTANETEDCYTESEDGLRDLRWVTERFSRELGDIPSEVLTALAQHTNHASLTAHTLAAYSLNSDNHDGAENYFLTELLRLLMLMDALDASEDGDPRAKNRHRKLLREQIAVLLHGMETTYMPYNGSCAKEVIESDLQLMGTKVEYLKPYMVIPLNEWEQLVQTGSVVVDDMHRDKREEAENNKVENFGKGIAKEAEKNKLREHRVLSCIKVMQRESHTYGWEEPLEFLDLRAEEAQGILYHRETSYSTSGKLTNSQAFELQMLRKMAISHDMNTWVFTMINREINEMCEFLRTQNLTVKPQKMQAEISLWLNSESENDTALRTHLSKESCWPSSAEAFEDWRVTGRIAYLEGIRNARCMVAEETGTSPMVATLFGQYQHSEAAKAKKIIEALGSKFIDIGGFGAPYLIGKGHRRESLMTIEHCLATNSLSGEGTDAFCVREGLCHGAWVVGKDKGFGIPHKTSAMECKNNNRPYETLNADPQTKELAAKLAKAFMIKGNGYPRDPVDYVLFSPQGDAQSPMPLIEQDDDTREPVTSGTGGWGSGGGGIATM